MSTREMFDILDACIWLIVSVFAFVMFCIVLIAWLLHGPRSLGLPGVWAHLVAVAAFAGLSEAASGRIDRIVAKYR